MSSDSRVRPITPAKIEFTDEELRDLRSAALQTWNEIAYDCFEAGGKKIKSLKKSEVIELVCDANRLEDRLRRNNRRALAEKISDPNVDLYALVRPAFPYATYS